MSANTVRLRGPVRRLFGALCLAACALVQPAHAALSSAELQERIDELVERGFQDEDAAVSALDRLLRQPGADTADARRALLAARALVAARAGRVDLARATLPVLRGLADKGDRIASADAALTEAYLEDAVGNNLPTREAAQRAVDGYAAACDDASPAQAPGAMRAAPDPGCSGANRWRALLLLGVSLARNGNLIDARNTLQAAHDLAAAHADLGRQALALSQLAVVSLDSGEAELAARQMSQALRHARLLGAPDVLVRVKVSEARAAHRREESETARRALEEALRIAEQAGLTRLGALALNNLSDHLIRNGQPREALQCIERALPVVRRYHDQRFERVLLHNAALARIGLGELVAAKQDVQRLLALWEQSGGAADQVDALREFGDALAKAGDPAAALELFHRERMQADAIRDGNRAAALQQMRTRFDREAQERSIELLERDNALKETELANRALAQRVWTLAGVILGLAVLMVLLLVRRMRQTHRQLAQSHALLRVQSERDPLTGLANRRRFQEVMRSRETQQVFAGALLLVDIDHFKQVNDHHGHAVGDVVLVEVARRLEEAVRAGDLAVRWGGEEFLVFAPAVSDDALEQLAGRLLQAIAATPVAVDHAELWITASIGYAGFPLPPHRVPLGWEPAVALADMALYTAKNQGRNRAVGICAIAAADSAAVQAVANDFEPASQDGRVELRTTLGPQRSPGDAAPAPVGPAAVAAPASAEALPIPTADRVSVVR